MFWSNPIALASNSLLTPPSIAGFSRTFGFPMIEEAGTYFKDFWDEAGHTRDVYEVEYKSGSLRKRRVAKVPKSEIDERSIITRINLSKGDLDEREVLALNKVRHPNIIEVYDAFPYQSRTVTIEEHIDAISLEELVRLGGPISDPQRFRQIFSQVIDGFEHLHTREGILHRDIKPSNILVGKHSDVVKIADLQNASPIDEVEDTLLATRGGTDFTHPDLLNALMTGKESKASFRSELYALGATMYYALTGETPFKRKLVPDKQGKKIVIDGSAVGVSLTQEGTKIEAVPYDEHRKKLSEALKKVPKQYRRLIEYSLSLDNKPLYVNYASFRDRFDEATEKKHIIPWRKIKQYGLSYVALAGILTGVVSGIKSCQIQERRAERNEPSLKQMLSSRWFALADYTNLFDTENAPLCEDIHPAFEDIRCGDLRGEGKKFLNDLEFVERTAGLGVGRRLASSLIRSVLMTKELPATYLQNRHSTSLVPKAFVDAFYKSINFIGGNRYNSDEKTQKLQKISDGMLYLRQCIGTERSLPDILSHYFCTEEEIFNARKQAGTMDYFSRNEQGIRKEGYRAHLAPHQRTLVDQAMALYYITDHSGNVHYELLDVNNKPTKGLEAK